MRLKGKTALITGAGSGIGKAAALLFAREGAEIVAGDIDAGALEKLIAQISGEGGKGKAFALDVADEAACRAAVQFTVEQFGKIDILMTNPWVNPFKKLHETSTAQWRKTMDVTLDGVYYCCKYAVKAMLKQETGGSIINNGSVRGFAAAPHCASYMAAKGAVAQLSKSIAMDYGKYNIRANVLSPGIIATPPTVESLDREQTWELAASEPMLKRIGTAVEVAYAALFLASDESAYVTGADLVVDGGLTGQV